MRTTFTFIVLLFIGNLLIAETPNTFEDRLKNTGVVPAQILVFTKTMGYRHKSIEKGVKTLKNLGKRMILKSLKTEDSLQFNDENLKQYQLVIFLHH